MKKEELELIAKAKSGDSDALEQLIIHYQNDLLRFCFFLTGNHPQSLDLCQETFIKVIMHLNQLKNISAFKGWMYKAAKNLFLDTIKGPQHKNNVYVPDEFFVQLNSFETSNDQNEEKIIHINKTLSLLRPEDKFLLLMIYMEEFSYNEVAQLLKIKEVAVKSRVFRAKKIFLKNYFRNK